ncbi:hypothetical protein IVB02_25995 [Bradyrhizobium sp. 166]|uniref:hypothetical protein n=1 Tax=Bradyrhizobium sp. 166 TaxID=2782638 RepID=UPI001FF9755B|nr:hypothetical protein [Bradyrhizobium sp. 166]MCK1604761.1 hypothetical protein [Bradyrhizobium sp. 166]
MWREGINKDALDRLLLRAEQEAALVPFVVVGLSLPRSSLGWAAFLNKIARTVAESGASAFLASQVSDDLAAGRYEEAAERIQRTAGRAMFNSAIDTFGDHKLARPKRSRRTANCVRQASALSSTAPLSCVIFTYQLWDANTRNACI